MITIIEGVDGTGKTSHAEWLQKTQGGILMHAGIPRHSHWFEEYISPIIAADEDQDIILDRWHVGEMIWPHIFDRPSIFKRRESFNLCNQMLEEMGAEIIVVVRSPDAISNTLMLRGEQDQIPDVLRAQDLYLDLAETIRNCRIVESDSLERDLIHVS